MSHQINKNFNIKNNDTRNLTLLIIRNEETITRLDSLIWLKYPISIFVLFLLISSFKLQSKTFRFKVLVPFRIHFNFTILFKLVNFILNQLILWYFNAGRWRNKNLKNKIYKKKIYFIDSNTLGKVNLVVLWSYVRLVVLIYSFVAPFLL